MQQHNQVLRNEILWRIAEASVLPLLANRAQIGAACHLLSIPAASPLLELETTVLQQPEHPNICSPAARALSSCMLSPVLERAFTGPSCSLALSIFFSEAGQGEAPQHNLGQSSQALVPAEELWSSAHHVSPAG